MTPAELVKFLQSLLDRWGPELIKEFCEVTWVAWDHDEEYEQLLKDILLRMLKEAQNIDEKERSGQSAG